MTEHDEQCLIFKWAECQRHTLPGIELLNGSLNGVRIPIGAAMKAKRAGMKRGFPDLALPVPRKDFNGLFIELKKTGGIPSDLADSQFSWLAALQDKGNFCAVAFGYDEAVFLLEWYLK